MLANMAASADCREEVTRNGGIGVLLHFLDAKHSKNSPSSTAHAQENNQNEVARSSHTAHATSRRPEDFAQMAATERVLQKSAIALSR